MSQPINEIYLDAAAASPLKKEVREAIFRWLDSYDLSTGNPNSIHAFGRRQKAILSQTSDRLLSRLNLTARRGQKKTHQVTFTASGTAANQLVVKSLFDKQLNFPRWARTTVEHASLAHFRPGHPSVPPVETLDIAVDPKGLIEWESLEEILRLEPDLISILWVNNETGVIQSMDQLVAFIRTRSPRSKIHFDIAQGLEKCALPESLSEVDALTLSAHKIGALAGTGVIVTRTNMGFRFEEMGTPNTLGILALGAALEAWVPSSQWETLTCLRLELEDQIKARIPGVIIHGAQAPRSPTITNFGIPDVPNSLLLSRLDLRGIAISAGAACSSGSLEPSHVLMAMGVGEKLARNSVRMSLHSQTKREELEAFLKTLENEVRGVMPCKRSPNPTQVF